MLVNNAGIMKFEDTTAKRDLTDAEATVVTNLLGPIRLIDALVDHLSRRPDATIINVTSGLAFVPLIAALTYSATKAAMHSYTVSLLEQLEGKIEVIEQARRVSRPISRPGRLAGRATCRWTPRRRGDGRARPAAHACRNLYWAGQDASYR